MIFLDDSGKHSHNLAAAALWFDTDNIGIVVHQRTNPIAIRQTAPGRKRNYVCSAYRLHTLTAAEKHALTLVHEQPYGAVFFFREHADVWLSGACRGFPVNVANIIARDIAPQFLEIEATPAQA